MPQEPSTNYQRLIEEIKSCGKGPKEIKLIAVSKNHSVEAIHSLYREGCRDFGESKVQEALPKIELLPKDIHWHFIGTLQKNKVRKVLGKFALFHGVDSPELAEKISSCSKEEGLTTHILLQVNTSKEVSKHGLNAEEWEEHLSPLHNLPALSIDGLMTMAPLTEDELKIRKCFSELRQLRDKWQKVIPTLEHLSMGMTQDYPLAIEEGTTLLRVGTALFGGR